jgi:hypothetical protein
MVKDLEDIGGRYLRHSGSAEEESPKVLLTGPLLCLTECGQHQRKSEGNEPKF